MGTSGAGKSTLAHLVFRFYEPVSGHVSLDGHDIRHLRVADLRAPSVGWDRSHSCSAARWPRISVMVVGTQTGKKSNAARLALHDSFIRDLPRGYEARIGECGLDLSGGQRARPRGAGHPRSPAIVILDEASAALDTETESRLWKGLASWMAGRTTLLIAHRLLTVLSCPRIVVIDEGRIAGDGTAEHLQRSCPVFERIFMEQMNLGRRAA